MTVSRSLNYQTALLAVSLATGIYLQNGTMLWPDLGWLIRSSVLLLEGQRFGTDLIEFNLPVAWYLCLPAAAAVKFLGVPEVVAIRAWIWVIVALCMVMALALRRYAEAIQPGHAACRWDLPIAGIAVCVLVGPSFGQREHLAFALTLPYVTLMVDGCGKQLRPVGLAAVAGVLAGIGAAIKPHFIVLPLAVEVVCWFVAKHRWTWRRSEVVAMGIAWLTAIGGTLVLAPDYLSAVVPMAAATYWAYDQTFPKVLSQFSGTGWPLLAGLALVSATRTWPAGATVWAACCVAWSGTYWLQFRGFDYQVMPAFGSAVALCGLLLGSLAGSLAGRPANSTLKTSVAAAFLVTVISSWQIGVDAWTALRRAGLGEASSVAGRRDLVTYLRDLGVGPGTRVFTFSTNPYPAFPTLNYLGADWVGPDLAQVFLPAWLRRNERMDPQDLALIEQAMMRQRLHVAMALLARAPDVILVAERSRSASAHGVGSRRVDYFAEFGRDPAVAAELAAFAEVGRVNSIRVFVRKRRSAIGLLPA